MNAHDLTLNIAINLGRISRWGMGKKEGRVQQFLQETQEYVNQLESVPKNKKFLPTFEKFKEKFHTWRAQPAAGEEWAEEVLTWANILQHRAKLA